ncbi:MAG: hypothetical protein A2W03_00085 [Candidatus Aminicenantes bacterium RBG_16_63_16]|nr:MAG: hypothetical protein A2W03_00085 [Candidatus Aminicenantes bacterium RBG_16_63_16]
MVKEKGQEVEEIGSVIGLAPFGSKEARRELRNRDRKPPSPEEEFENKVWLVIHSLRPEFISVGKDPKIILDPKPFISDVIAIFEQCVLLVEAKDTEAQTFISDWISKFREGRKNRLEECLKKKYHKKFVESILATKDSNSILKRHKDEIHQMRIKIMDDRDLNYYRSIQRATGIGVEHLFWGRIAPKIFSPENEPIPALCIRLGKKKEAYIFAANPRDILCRSFISHRELHEPEEGVIGYQRMLQPKKLNKIAQFISDGNNFPTPIVVAFRKAGKYFQQTVKEQQIQQGDHKTIIFGHVRLPSETGSMQLIDGQHRLFGYTKVEYNENHIIQVVAYNRLVDPSPANLFVEINHEQTPVKSNLLWELYPDIYSPDDPQYYLAVISRAIESSISKEIPDKVEHISRGTHGPITFQTLCGEVKKTGLVGKNSGILFAATGINWQQVEERLESVFNALFGAMIDLGKDNVAVNSEFFFTNNGIIPIIRIAARIIGQDIKGDLQILSRRQILQEVFKKYLTPLYEFYGSKTIPDLAHFRRAGTGNSGQNKTDDRMTELIRKEKPNFPFRAKYFDKEYEDLIHEVANKADQINSTAVSSGKISSWVFKEFHSRDFIKSLSHPIDNEAGFTHLLTILYKEFHEGSGKDSPDNRIKKILNLQKIYDLPIFNDLNNLRNSYEHKETQLPTETKRGALEIIRGLPGLQDLPSKHELQPEEYILIAKTLLKRFNTELMDRLLSYFRTGI